jgi:hypothetical protein
MFLIHMSTSEIGALVGRSLVEALQVAFPEVELQLEASPSLAPLWADLGPVNLYLGGSHAGSDAYPGADQSAIFVNAALEAYPELVDVHGPSGATLYHAFNARIAELGLQSQWQLKPPTLRPLTNFRTQPGVEVPPRSVLLVFGEGFREEHVRTFAAAYPTLTFYSPLGDGPNVRPLPSSLVDVTAVADRCAALVVGDPTVAVATDSEANLHKDRLVLGTAQLIRFDGSSRTQHLTDISQLVAVLNEVVSTVPLFEPRKWVASSGPRTVLFVSHSAKQCGVGDYGRNVSTALKAATRYRVEYAECDNAFELISTVDKTRPDAVLYNHAALTMGWLSSTVTRSMRVPQIGILHDFTPTSADTVTPGIFDAYLAQDPTLVSSNSAVWATQRLLPVYDGKVEPPERITVGSFGFGYEGKGFRELIQRVNEEFDEADIRLHIPSNDVIDLDGTGAVKTAEAALASQELKPGIRVIIDHEFFTKAELLDFLAGNTLNAFLYDPVIRPGLGISSVIDYALAVRRPLAITPSGMFRHVLAASPTITTDRASLREIIENGTRPLEPFYEQWSQERFVEDYERIFDEIFEAYDRGAGR